MGEVLPLLAISEQLQANLVIAATVLFLVFATCGFLISSFGEAACSSDAGGRAPGDSCKSPVALSPAGGNHCRPLVRIGCAGTFRLLIANSPHPQLQMQRPFKRGSGEQSSQKNDRQSDQKEPTDHVEEEGRRFVHHTPVETGHTQRFAEPDDGQAGK